MSPGTDHMYHYYTRITSLVRPITCPIIAVSVEEVMSTQSPNPGFVPESWSLYSVGALFIILRL